MICAAKDDSILSQKVHKQISTESKLSQINVVENFHA